jgi:hypothetical protein
VRVACISGLGFRVVCIILVRAHRRLTRHALYFVSWVTVRVSETGMCVCLCVFAAVSVCILDRHKCFCFGLLVHKLKASYTSSLRPHTLVALGLIH